VGLSIQGAILNEPPHASAGPDRVVECNKPNAATFTLDASASLDPDNNAASFVWLRGSRAGSTVGFQPVVQVEQSLSTPTDYIFRILDTFGQGDEDTTHAQVVDTTPPVIACNAPPWIVWPFWAPLSLKATARDICDPTVVPTITSAHCFRIEGRSGRLGTDGGCKLTVQGNELTLEHPNGFGDLLEWSVRAVDSSGNASTRKCEAIVVKW
jgi:hypothetical protein